MDTSYVVISRGASVQKPVTPNCNILFALTFKIGIIMAGQLFRSNTQRTIMKVLSQNETILGSVPGTNISNAKGERD